MKIEDGKIVAIAYTLKGDDDAILDAADAKDPLEYLHGPDSGLIAGLVKALEGRIVGDHVSLSLTPDDGYGARDDSKIRKVPLRRFGAQKVRVGARLGMDSGGGRIEGVLVLSLQGDYATVDPNHPLAGKNLQFEVDVVQVRDATAEEREHGHPHSPDHPH
jgi:FKBP-type peptidyl-prolyl cis-trans isomerase SlyD